MAHFVTVPYTHLLLDLDHAPLDTATSLESAGVDATPALDTGGPMSADR